MFSQIMFVKVCLYRLFLSSVAALYFEIFYFARSGTPNANPLADRSTNVDALTHELTELKLA